MSDFYGRRQFFDARTGKYFTSEQEARDFELRVREQWENRQRGYYGAYVYPNRERSPRRYYRNFDPHFYPLTYEQPEFYPDHRYNHNLESQYGRSFEDQQHYLDNEARPGNSGQRGREDRQENSGGGSGRKLKALKGKLERRPREKEQPDDPCESEEEDGGDDDRDRNRPWLPRGTQEESEIVLVESSTTVSKEISDEIKYTLEFEDPSFSIKPPKLDSFMLRHAKDKNCVKAVCAAEEAHIATQLKIMDIAPPLIDLYCKVCALDEGEEEAQAKMAVQAVLQRWGRAYHYITQKRRWSVVSLVDPAFDFLLSTPSAYAPRKEAVELLFTEKFLESMLKEATQDATLANSVAARERTQAGRRKATSPQASRPGFCCRGE
ncbi:hypothetical protein OUZ56_023783 [Daphnia magna]|uniref:Uncharacterized protein n=1 Tax=Daphnia magna TaxID=35525 RepID=A0ABR0AZP7_9CRUS|nr:hypothetical protein OUZ56_023783 [Daphnia magna]